MTEKILVTGGAGFIGSHLVDTLLAANYEVRVLDNLEPQVHGGLRENNRKPEYLNPDAEFVLGDIRDQDTVIKAIENIDVIFHEAALVGVGQSMYEISRYTETNVAGTAVLLQAIVDAKKRPRKLVVASSMSIYGEGSYTCPMHNQVFPELRTIEQLTARDWELFCPHPGCMEQLAPCPTSEEKPLAPTSVYAINKRDQEEMFLAVGNAYNVPTVALRYFNTYGTRQALSNPYTGVAAIFSSRMLNGSPPVIYEDGKQSRDFVHVKDVVQANLLVMNNEEANYQVFNVGTGRTITILEVAEILATHFQRAANQFEPDRGSTVSYQPEITAKFRAGDIRHCYSDINRLSKLGYHPTVSFEAGIEGLLEWVVKQSAVDGFDQVRKELSTRGLAI